MRRFFIYIFLLLPGVNNSFSQTMTVEKKILHRTAELNISSLPAPDKGFNRIEEKRRINRTTDSGILQNETMVKNKKIKETKVGFPVTYMRTSLSGNLNAPIAPLINETPCITYPALRFSTNFPPDVSAAVGFDHLFMALNDSMAILDKYGFVLRAQRQNDGTGFWSALDTTGLFDPKIVYQPYYNRWFYVIGTDARTAQSAFLIAVSQTPDPMQAWNYYRVDADSDDDQWFDYPSIGFNKNWFVVNGNMGENNGTGVTQSRTFIFNIFQLMAGSSVDYAISNYSNALDPQFTICPALTYDPLQNDLWLVTNDDINDNDLRFFKIIGGPSNPSMTEEGFVSIGTNWGQGGMNIAPQLGNPTRINCADHDVLSVIWRNGRLYTAQTVFLPDGGSPSTCTIQIVSCNPYNETVFESFRIFSDANNMYAYPNLAVNADNDLVISCAKFANTIYPSASVIVRRNGSNTLYETIFKAGEDWYVRNDGQGRNRWGDYTSAMVDPSDDNSIWVASEYSTPRIQPGDAGNFGTWWAKICAGSCAVTTFVNTTQSSGTYKKFEASFSVIGQSQISSGANIKLDAGTRIVLQPGFRALEGCRVRTYLEGCGGVQ